MTLLSFVRAIGTAFGIEIGKNILFAALITVSSVLTVMGVVLALRVNRVMRKNGTIQILGRVEAIEPDDQKPGLRYPVFEAALGDEIIRFRGQSAKNAGGFAVGESVKLYYNEAAGTATEGSILTTSRFVGLSVSLVGLVVLGLSVLLHSRW